MPPNFSWIEQPRLAAMAFPESAEDIAWLRRHGVEVLLSLTEEPPPRDWVNDAGLLQVHVPVPDMTAPSERQLDKILDSIQQAHATNLGVAVHCTAGRGRTGTVVAAYFVAQGLNAREAIEKTRLLRPGSIESSEQEELILALARRRAKAAGQ